jgi:hypothetical protein
VEFLCHERTDRLHRFRCHRPAADKMSSPAPGAIAENAQKINERSGKACENKGQGKKVVGWR